MLLDALSSHQTKLFIGPLAVTHNAGTVCFWVPCLMSYSAEYQREFYVHARYTKFTSHVHDAKPLTLITDTTGEII